MRLDHDSSEDSKLIISAITDPASAPADKLPNELSAPYEVPHFPIEKIETKKLKYVRAGHHRDVV